ncbi:MAG TPA: hypothetical protein VMW11_00435 [Candidatus Dormibacteraeota bacterium]|nr:hypothetical protein [Candidatus Dormibacteraeota bacterium]
MNLSDLLLVAALIVFVLAAVGWGFKKIDLIAIGLALWALSQLIGISFSNLKLSTILLILAFIAFVLAAVGWKYKKVGLLGVGLALWVASILVPLVVK